MGIVGTKLNIDYVISTGDNFYESGLTGPDDTQFTTSFSEIYTQESLQTTWYSGAAAKLSTSLFCVQNVVVQDACRCVQFWDVLCCCWALNAKVLYCKMHLLRTPENLCNWVVAVGVYPQCWAIMTIVAMQQRNSTRNSLSVTPAGSAAAHTNWNGNLACQIKVSFGLN